MTPEAEDVAAAAVGSAGGEAPGAVDHVAVVAADSDMGRGAGSCAPVGTRRSIRDHCCWRSVLFVPVHNPTRGHSSADEPQV